MSQCSAHLKAILFVACLITIITFPATITTFDDVGLIAGKPTYSVEHGYDFIGGIDFGPIDESAGFRIEVDTFRMALQLVIVAYLIFGLDFSNIPRIFSRDRSSPMDSAS